MASNRRLVAEDRSVHSPLSSQDSGGLQDHTAVAMGQSSCAANGDGWSHDRHENPCPL